MTKIFTSPSKYIQGAGQLHQIGYHAKQYGTRAFVLISENGRHRFGQILLDSFTAAEIGCTLEYLHGVCCESEVNRLCEVVKQQLCDVVIGVGGGKILDVAKLIAHKSGTPVVTCPTVASTSAPSSALCILHNEQGQFEREMFLPQNPNLVLVDTEVIAASPMRFTIAGMGNALAAYFEARVCASYGEAGQAALALAKLGYDTLMAQGLKAKSALRAKACTQAVEKVIEANILLAGIGLESGGFAAAHAVQRGLDALEESHQKYYGEQVAFGVLTQLILEDVPKDELDEVAIWCAELGLPITLYELGIEEDIPEKVMTVVQIAYEQGGMMQHMPFPVTSKMLYDAILAADAYGKSLVGM